MWFVGNYEKNQIIHLSKKWVVWLCWNQIDLQKPLYWNYNILDIIAQNGFIIPLLPFIQFWKKWRQFTIFLLHCCQGIFCQNTKILVFVWGQLSNRKMDSWNLKVRLLFQVIGFGHRINLYFSYIMLTWNRGEFHSCLLFT